MLEHGIDVSGHRAAQILTMTARHKAAVVAMFPDAAAEVFTLSSYATGTDADIADAYGKPPPVDAQVYGRIASAIGPALAKGAQR